MSDDETGNDGFDDIVKGNQPGSGDRELHFHTITEAVQQVYPILYDGVLIRAVVIIDRLNGEGNRELIWVHDSNTQPWESLGLVQQVLNDMNAENQFAINRILSQPPEDEEEGEQ